MIISIIVAIIICAFAYRIGGMSKEEARKKLPWFPAFLVRGFTRDLVCMLTVMAWVYFFLPRVENSLYFYSAVLMYGAMTTYWDRFPGCKGEDNFFMHGLFIGLALLPIAYGSGLWMEVIARAFVLGFLMHVWCAIFSNVDMEEYARGGFIALTLLLLIPGFI